MANRGSTLAVNEYLGTNDSLMSPNGRFCAIMQGDGNLCVYEGLSDNAGNFRWGWADRSRSQDDYFTIMQSDGNLVIYTSPNRPIWASGTAGNPGSWLRVQDDRPRLRRIYLEVLRLTASVNAPLYAYIAVFAPEITAVLFGDRWADSGQILRLLAVMGFLRSTGNPVGALVLAALAADYRKQPGRAHYVRAALHRVIASAHAERLSAAGVPTELHVYPGAFHAFDVFGAGTRIAQQFNADRDAVLRRALHR